MAMTEANELPISAFTTSAQVAEVNTIETLIDLQAGGTALSGLTHGDTAVLSWTVAESGGLGRRDLSVRWAFCSEKLAPAASAMRLNTRKSEYGAAGN